VSTSGGTGVGPGASKYDLITSSPRPQCGFRHHRGAQAFGPLVVSHFPVVGSTLNASRARVEMSVSGFSARLRAVSRRLPAHASMQRVSRSELRTALTRYRRLSSRLA